jgi:mRNA interferase MazF
MNSPTLNIESYDIVLVPFPFSDLSSKKQRPCLVLASYRPRSLPSHLVVAMITSQIKKPHFPFDVVLRDYESAKLPLPSLVRIGKIVTIDTTIVKKKLGSLTEVDRKSIRNEFKKLFSL